MPTKLLLGTLLVLTTLLVASSATRKTAHRVDKYFQDYRSLIEALHEMGLWQSKEYDDSEEADDGTTFEDVDRVVEEPTAVTEAVEETTPEPITEKVTIAMKKRTKKKGKRPKKKPQFLEEKYDDVRFGANGVDGVDTKSETNGLEFGGGRGGKGGEGTQKSWGGNGGEGANGNGPTPLKKPKSGLPLTGKPVWVRQSNTTSNSAKLEKTASSELDFNWWWHPDGAGRKVVANEVTNTKRSAVSNKGTAQIEGYQNGVKSNIDSVRRESTQQSGRNVTAERGEETVGDVRIISVKDLTSQSNDETAGRLRKTGEHIRLDDGQGSDVNYVSNATSSRGVATVKEDINQITDLKGLEVIEQSKRDGISSYRTADRNDVANKTMVVKKNKKKKKRVVKPPPIVDLPIDE